MVSKPSPGWDIRGRVICIEGDEQHQLCVYREQSVRSPREARALMQQGCWDEEPPSGALSSFVRAVRSAFGETFASARYAAGRVVLAGRNRSAVTAAQQLAEQYGLSTFDGSVTRALLTDPSSLTLFQCCSALRDQSARALTLKADGFRIFVSRDADQQRRMPYL